MEEIDLALLEKPGQALSTSLIQAGLGMVSKTPDGTGYAFTLLDLTQQGVCDLSALGDSYGHVRYLRAPYNELKDATLSKLEALPNLLTADLSFNCFETVLECPALQYLQQLNLAHNRIALMNAVVHHSLEKLNLNYNFIQSISGLDSLHRLSILELRGNKLANVNGLKALPNLKELYLAENSISSVEGLDQPTVEILHLRSNKFASLESFKSSNLPEVRVLNLRSNLLEDVSQVEHLQALPSLSKLSINGNPSTEDGVEGSRVEVLSFLLRLKGLDKGEPFSEEEMTEAKETRTTRDEEREEARRQAEEEERERLAQEEEERRAAAEAEAEEEEEG